MSDIYRAKILLVDDEAALRHMAGEFLREAGFQRLYFAENCAQAMEIFEREEPDCALLDVMLPDGDGFDLMKRMRAQRDMPIVFLSARDEDEARLRGLGLGADDYITKPFLPKELELRLIMVLRRWLRAPMPADQLALGDVRVDWAEAMVRGPRGEFPLTAKEVLILKKLAAERGRIVSIDALCCAVWTDGSFGYENTLMVHIRRLREKIERDPSRPQWLITVRGLGYKLQKEART
jgi:two-component system response regulator VicR